MMGTAIPKNAAFPVKLPLILTINQIAGATGNRAMSVKLGFSEARREAFTAACFGSTEKISDSTVWSLNSVTIMRRPRAWRSHSMSVPISFACADPKLYCAGRRKNVTVFSR